MKKLLLILLCVPLIGLGQELGDYYISEGDPKTHGLDFKIKKPIGYYQYFGTIPTTIVGFGTVEKDIEIHFLISVYPDTHPLSEKFKKMDNSEIKNHIQSIDGMEYYELCGYPGATIESGDDIGSLLQSFIFINNKQFWIKLTVMDKHIPSELEDLFYKMCNTLEFIQ